MEYHVTIEGEGPDGSTYTVHRVLPDFDAAARYIGQYTFENRTVSNVKFRGLEAGHGSRPHTLGFGAA